MGALTKQVLDALRPDTLHLIILPTEKCNFRCSYCYEDFALGKMPPKVVKGIISLIQKRQKSLTRLSISWFGGEPLLAFDIIKGISTAVQEICAKYNIEYSADVTSNGYLLKPAVFFECLAKGVKHFQISLDGDPDDHDKKRPLINGRGTFTTIWKNLCDIKSEKNANFRITLRTHFDLDNIENGTRFLEKMATQFASDHRFAFYLRHVSRLGGVNDSKLNILDSHGREQIGNLRYYANTLGLAVIDEGMEDYICYAAKPNSFVIRANGQVAKCTVAFNQEENSVGYLTETGELHLDQNKMRVWATGLETNEADQLSCPWVGVFSRRGRHHDEATSS